MDDANKCGDLDNRYIYLNKDEDAVFIHAWGSSNPLKNSGDSCILTVKEYSGYGLRYSFVGKASDNHVESCKTILSLWEWQTTYNNLIVSI